MKDAWIYTSVYPTPLHEVKNYNFTFIQKHMNSDKCICRPQLYSILSTLYKNNDWRTSIYRNSEFSLEYERMNKSRNFVI